MSELRPQPLLCVRDVQLASLWYQRVLDCTSGHGGDEYERIMSGRTLVLQLHALEEDHHHGALADPKPPLGNGVAIWFEVLARTSEQQSRSETESSMVASCTSGWSFVTGQEALWVGRDASNSAREAS